MRDRHLPRVCHNCSAPMARQDDSCWRCGAVWTVEPELRAMPVSPTADEPHEQAA
jgi:predicted amidophosphoribosyltransferase